MAYHLHHGDNVLTSFLLVATTLAQQTVFVVAPNNTWDALQSRIEASGLDVQLVEGHHPAFSRQFDLYVEIPHETSADTAAQLLLCGADKPCWWWMFRHGGQRAVVTLPRGTPDDFRKALHESLNRDGWSATTTSGFQDLWVREALEWEPLDHSQTLPKYPEHPGYPAALHDPNHRFHETERGSGP